MWATPNLSWNSFSQWNEWVNLNPIELGLDITPRDDINTQLKEVTESIKNIGNVDDNDLQASATESHIDSSQYEAIIERLRESDENLWPILDELKSILKWIKEALSLFDDKKGKKFN